MTSVQNQYISGGVFVMFGSYKLNPEAERKDLASGVLWIKAKI